METVVEHDNRHELGSVLKMSLNMIYWLACVHVGSTEISKSWLTLLMSQTNIEILLCSMLSIND